MRKVHSQHRPCPSPHSHPLFLLLRPPFRPAQSEQRVLNQSQRRPAARHHTPLLVPLLRLPSPRRVHSSALLFSNHFLQTNTQRVQHSQQPNHFLLVSLSTRPLAPPLPHSALPPRRHSTDTSHTPAWTDGRGERE
ncbi:hypothetical protein BLNAU_1004 [Blattamonas nauphoetae]|uniref:Uncharacterized protein n=1 Tax=Blattamonas nauphoetae TaxID=2049346 RepID=A0ABQ9YJL2_9EUKA|nr:hypothetical protein BLNAU_1004 [Blattamonas nauphoetae]